MPEFTLTSPAFGDREPIPDEYGYTARNVNPPLEIEGVPSDAESLVIIVDDPDAMEPAGQIWDHWLVWNVDPDTASIPADWDARDAGATEGQNDFGEHGYGGPNPPDRKHTYRFGVYALDETLDHQSAADKAALQDAMTGHIVADARLEGTYAP